MITKRYKQGTTIQGQTARFLTDIMGKEYYWMTDPEENWYLARVGKHGEPVII